MGNHLIVRMDDETKMKFQRLSRMEGKTASEKIREMIESYIQKSDVGALVDDLWERIGRRIREKGFKERDIPKVLRKVRGMK